MCHKLQENSSPLGYLAAVLEDAGGTTKHTRLWSVIDFDSRSIRRRIRNGHKKPCHVVPEGACNIKLLQTKPQLLHLNSIKPPQKTH